MYYLLQGLFLPLLTALREDGFEVTLEDGPRILEVLFGVRLGRGDAVKRFVENGDDALLFRVARRKRDGNPRNILLVDTRLIYGLFTGRPPIARVKQVFQEKLKVSTGYFCGGPHQQEVHTMVNILVCIKDGGLSNMNRAIYVTKKYVTLYQPELAFFAIANLGVSDTREIKRCLRN